MCDSQVRTSSPSRTTPSRRATAISASADARGAGSDALQEVGDDADPRVAPKLRVRHEPVLSTTDKKKAQAGAAGWDKHHDSPLAAVGLAIIMALAVPFHIMRGEANVIGLHVIVVALSVFVAWGRYRKAPIAPKG
jgi:hypothetical protein